MSKSELLKLKKQIDKLLQKAEDEAVEEGINIASAEFGEVLLQLKTKLLEERGITLDTYNQMMAELNAEKRVKKEAKEEKQSELIKKISMMKGETGDIGYNPIKGKDYFDGKDGRDGYTPIKNIDYFDGKTGEDGIDGKDGRDGKDGKNIKGDRGEKGDKGKDAKKIEIPDWTKRVEDLDWQVRNIISRRGKDHGYGDAGSFSNAILDSRYYKKAEVDAAIASAGAGDLKADGTVPLTADWDVGLFDITAVEFKGALIGNADTVTGLSVTASKTLTVTESATISAALGTGAYATIADYALVGQQFYIGTTQVAINRGTGALTLAGLTLTTPDIGTPSAGVLTSCTGLPAAGVVNTAATLTDTQTLTNKRITPRVTTEASSATPTINTDNSDVHGLTAQAVDITSFTTNLTGTPTNGQKLLIYIVGTATRAITWGASFENGAVNLPVVTKGTTRLNVSFIYNSVAAKWDCMAVGAGDLVGTVASAATPAINTDNNNAYSITAQAEAITSFTTNLTGTPTNFQKIIIRIKDNGTARAITWGASFVDKGAALPTTTVISKCLTVGFIYDSVAAVWGCVAVVNET